MRRSRRAGARARGWPTALVLGAFALLFVLGTACGDRTGEAAARPLEKATARPAPSPRAADPGKGPSIVLVTIDTLRADHVSAYGYGRPTTPNLDALAAGGARFADAYAMSSTTLPSHSSLFTSRSLDEHGVTKNGLSLPPDVPTLAEALRAAGWDTAAFVSSFVLERQFGLARGFDRYDDDFTGADHSSAIQNWEGHHLDAPYDRRASETTDHALAWLAKRDDARPFFLWVHYFDPHSPYDPPSPHREAFLEHDDPHSPLHDVDLYDGDVHYADAELGRLLAATARYAPLTIVTGDHGEGLWDHGWLEHGVFLYESMVRVPWIVSWPGVIPAGRVVGGLASHVDLVPTLAALIGRPLIADARGLGLSGELRGTAEPDPRRAIHLQRRDYDPMQRGHLRVAGSKRAIRVGDWKLILSPQEIGLELYDLAHDPGERHNLAGLRPDVVQDLGSQLLSWQRGQHVHGATAQAPGGPSPETSERLRALGYVE